MDQINSMPFQRSLSIKQFRQEGATGSELVSVELGRESIKTARIIEIRQERVDEMLDELQHGTEIDTQHNDDFKDDEDDFVMF